MRTRAKICGITRDDDALAAAKHGADAVGFVFHEPSPRCIDIDTAISIARKLPPFVAIVGLFVNAGPENIEGVLSRLHLDCLQFHGSESPEECSRYGMTYIKSVAMREDVDLASVAARYEDAAGLLLDTYVPGVDGGSGKTFDWTRIPRDIDLPLILAGGLNPENVGAAIRQVQPYAVDVSSGVETSKGIKDAARIVAFLNEVNKIP